MGPFVRCFFSCVLKNDGAKNLNGDVRNDVPMSVCRLNCDLKNLSDDGGDGVTSLNDGAHRCDNVHRRGVPHYDVRCFC